MTSARYLNGQRRLLLAKWRFVVPLSAQPPWWKFWVHRHHHRMTFPVDGTLDWRFTCKCGHTTDNIEEATP